MLCEGIEESYDQNVPAQEQETTTVYRKDIVGSL